MKDPILEDREKRYYKILDLIDNFKLPVLCGKLNYPGNNKNTAEAFAGFNILVEEVSKTYCNLFLHVEILNGFDGPSIIMVLNMEGEEAKRTSIQLEDTHFLGRIFDIDIYDNRGNPISRENYKLGRRKCLVCDEDGKLCTRAARHSMEDLLYKINTQINIYGDLKNGS